MAIRKSIIMGISPGTQAMGIAVLNDGRLREARIRTIKGRWSDEKLKRIIQAIELFVMRNKVEIISIKINHTSRISSSLEKVITEIKRWAKRKKIPVYTYTIDELKKICTETKRANKKSLTASIIERFPDFIWLCEKENKNKHPYHIKIFEAIACCLVCRKKRK